ncbi:MAG: OprO/OprP family phosphate-selective porin [Thermoanaerobaculia bacterium]|nr:OprO/OprP family phosphate-selective porin [Thermoanaerobaculia bacterium]
MKRFLNGLGALALSGAVLLLAALTGAVLLGFTLPAAAQGLWYKEVAKEGRIYVFNTAVGFAAWEKSGEIGNKAITMISQGPNGETVVAENEVAIDLYNLKHDRPGYNRPAPKPAAPSIPTTLKVGDGELKFGLLVQTWYITDDSTAGTVNRPSGGAAPVLGNTAGFNTFRLRRSEIKLNGRITPAWGFEVMLDPSKAINPQTAGTDAKILQDLAVTYLGLKGHELSLGQKKITLTEEGLRSSSELDFAERSQVVRAVSDRRETGFFYKGEVGELVTFWSSITNGVVANQNDDSNDSVNFAGRLDFKPMHGLLVGVSGLTSGGEGRDHLGRTRWGVHVKYDGGPLGFRAEFVRAEDESGTAAAKTMLGSQGWYATVLYSFTQQWQLGVRYDEFTKNTGVDPLNKIKTFTGGLHYLVKGKNMNLKLNYLNVKEDNRTVTLNGVTTPEDSYSQFVVAAQVAF